MRGIIYHVVDKTSQEVVKVGSTMRSLAARWKDYDKEKYSDHFLREAKVIESDEDEGSFHWHLIAAEHCEMVRQGTFRKGKLSNQASPLDQKYWGFDCVVGAKLGGKANVESGHLQRISSLGGLAASALSMRNKTGLFDPSFDLSAAGKRGAEISIKKQLGIHNPNFDKAAAAKLGGQKNVESGHIHRIRTAEGSLKGGITQGKRNAESGYMSKVGKKYTHIRWHVNRGIVSPTCSLCQEAS